MRILLPLLALLLAACPEQIGQQCPPRTTAIGQYDLAFTGEHDAGECAALPGDGGTTRTLLTRDAGPQQSAAICFGTVDGGPGIYLVVPTKGTRTSELSADGGFRFTAHGDPVQGTECGCLIGADETFEGWLLASPAGTAFALRPDGGLPDISGLTASVTDTLFAPAGVSGCLCDVPCTVTYTVTGTRK